MHVCSFYLMRKKHVNMIVISQSKCIIIILELWSLTQDDLNLEYDGRVFSTWNWNKNVLFFLGDYYRTEELTEQVQESLSSSSLRRKLFLDGHDSGSESSTPSSPDKNSHNEISKNREMMSSVVVSPLQTGISTAGTPLSVCTKS